MKIISKLVLGMAFAAFAAYNATADNLVILHTNDTHSQIDPDADGLGGVARRKVLIDSVRAEHQNVLLVDAGDVVQGTTFFNLYKGEIEEKLMNALGYDLRILGNHEFDNGLAELAKNVKMADATFLASNYGMKDTPLEGLFVPYALKTYDDKTIAFIPVNLQPKGMISGPNYEGMTYVDGIEAANHLAWVMKHILGADKVVALTHIGYSESATIDDVELAESSKDIDVIIGGHSHTFVDPANPKSPKWLVKNAEGRDVLIAQTGNAGRNLGEIIIDLDDLETVPTSKLIRVDSRLDSRVDPAIEQIIAPYREKVNSLNTTYVGKSAKMLDRKGDALLNFVSDFVYDRGAQLADNIDLSMVNQGGIRTSLPKGNVSQGDIISMLPFFNRVQVIEIPGDSLIAAFNIMPRTGVKGVSKNVKAKYDPETFRATEVSISGKPIDPAKTYRIATIDYLANGGDYMTPLVDSKTVAVSPDILFDDLLYFLTEGAYKGKTINPADTRRISPVK